MTNHKSWKERSYKFIEISTGFNQSTVLVRLCSPVLRKSTMLNMERTVGTITPKKVFSLRGSLLGEPWPDSGVASESARHAADTVSPHTPEGIRGVRSFDMTGVRGLSARPVKREKLVRTHRGLQL